MVYEKHEQLPADGPGAFAFNLMAKPVGALCNLDCVYCFYKEKQNARPMSESILEEYIRQYILSQDIDEISFIWQGGEPTLAGLPFYEKAVALQGKYADGKRILNSIQTNGTLLDDEWCAFLLKNNFLTGLSLDGTAAVHDRFRADRDGKPTSHRVMAGLEMLKKHGVEFNILAAVTGYSSRRSLETYRFFKESGAQFIQFIPIVAREIWAVEPEAYGDFLISIFDEWFLRDIGQIVVLNFEWALHSWLGHEPPTCQFSTTCGMSMVLESDGNVYSCDHYVEPGNLLGNICRDDLLSLVTSSRQTQFGLGKEKNLPGLCRDCSFLFACRGGCPKDRYSGTRTSEAGRNRLCMGYKKFFEHVDEKMIAMGRLIAEGQPLSPAADWTRK